MMNDSDNVKKSAGTCWSLVNIQIQEFKEKGKS